MSSVVMDASAVMALMNAETGASVVAENIPGSVIGAVNLSEVIAKLCSRGMPEGEARSDMEALGLQIIPFDEPQAYQCGLLISATKSAGLSLGDRACLALAKMLGKTALTTDRAWAKLSVGVDVTVIR